MRTDLISEASRRLHRRRGRVLIAASVAVLILGSALSIEIALSWRRDRGDAAAKRFQADEQLLESNVRSTLSTYVHALQVTRGFFRADPSATRSQFLTFASSLAVEVVVALGAAIARPYTSLAAGTLVPVYGLALCGLWAARHGTFPPREPPEERSRKGGRRDR